jgi:hypothetical protein
MMLSMADPVPHAFVALMVALVVPAVVAVPVIAPVLVLSDAQAGRPVALKLAGLSVPVML